MQLTPHFALSEFVDSATATAKGIDNTPPEPAVRNLTDTAEGMEKVRALLGNLPMRITSGFRCAELNHYVGGTANSAHLRGHAADFECPAYGTPLQIVEFLQKCASLQFDQCIQEGTWVHISFDPAMRRQVLTAQFHENGETTYSGGVA